ncbi:MAG TPA: hotdog domain-containing protein, partial [Lysobacter sp.]|nr:hotdog domain-containing protein [Lysobacter sp.]
MAGHDRELTLRFLAQPTDVNYGGKVHGGAVMKWIDQAGYAAAVAWSGHYSVTVAVGGIRFLAPIRISDLVTLQAKLVHTGTSSMHFVVEVQARDP